MQPAPDSSISEVICTNLDYAQYGISYRELQEMLAERGVNVDHSTIYRWVQRYAPEMEKRLRW
ncbi:IS6 family transposase, partial [Enterobacter hormaechei]|nr:IS6 family transposase [Enterobacter hormaechei]